MRLLLDFLAHWPRHSYPFQGKPRIHSTLEYSVYVSSTLLAPLGWSSSGQEAQYSQEFQRPMLQYEVPKCGVQCEILVLLVHLKMVS